MAINKLTMEFQGEKGFGYHGYKCIETGYLYLDTNCGDGEPDLHSCGDSYDNDPGFRLKNEVEIHYVNRPKQINKHTKDNYLLLDRLQIDCEYYLNNGNRNLKHLWAPNEKEQIEMMKELFNSFPEDKKPEWLTYEQILQYEQQMNPDNNNNYMLLSKLQTDCKFFLGVGRRNLKYLWAEDEKGQIAKMKELYNSLSEKEKPEWLTFEQILQYEQQMIS